MSDKPSEFETIARFSYRHDAEFARGFLDDAGIPSELEVDDAGGFISPANTSALVVRAEDAMKARAVLDEADVDYTT